MKRLLLFSAALGASMAMFAQPINRKALIEEFTSATCGPCASQNPAFNALILPNRDVKVVPVKYQVPIPSPGDPMYAQNQPESDARRSYYGINGAPTATLNGRIPDNNNTPGGGWSGYAGGPYGFNQTVIDNEFNDLTSFSLVLDHWVSEDLDSVYATITITNVDVMAITNSNLKLRVALLEETITFATAPGSNGETTFEEVMRKMIPNATGTTVASSWNPGESFTIELEALIPTYIYDYTELSMSAWLQDDATKEVLQADYNDPAAVQGNDAALVIDDLGAGDYCETSLAPVLEISNEGTMTFTSVDIDVVINGSVQFSETWTGSLAPGASANYTLTSAVNLNSGVNDVEFRITGVDNGPDISNSNNVDGDQVVSVASGEELPFDENFEGESVGEFPEDVYVTQTNGDWPIVLNQSWATWITNSIGGHGNSEQSLWFALGYSTISAGSEFSFVTDNFNFSTYQTAGLSFSYAYAQLSAGENSEFSVEVSVDCGDTWTSVWSESGNDLQTAGVDNQFILMPEASEWADVEIDLTENYAQEEQLMFRFAIVKDAANGLFIDDISVFGTETPPPAPIGISENLELNIELFPNPANDVINITGIEGVSVIKVYDAMGRLVINTTTDNSVLNVSDLNSGVYTLVVENSGAVSTERITIAK